MHKTTIQIAILLLAPVLAGCGRSSSSDAPQACHDRPTDAQIASAITQSHSRFQVIGVSGCDVYVATDSVDAVGRPTENKSTLKLSLVHLENGNWIGWAGATQVGERVEISQEAAVLPPH